MKRNIIIVLAIVLSVFLCEKPNFHPEAMFHSPYHWWLDMMFHGGYYFTITALLFPLFNKQNFNWAYFLIVLLLSYGLEVDQLLVPGRSFSLLDLTSNTLGISMAAILWLLWGRMGKNEMTANS
jgi:VanZ family protein